MQSIFESYTFAVWIRSSANKAKISNPFHVIATALAGVKRIYAERILVFLHTVVKSLGLAAIFRELPVSFGTFKRHSTKQKQGIIVFCYD